MKTNTISRKIRIIGVFFIILMTSIILSTIYLNEKNKKDALVINIAGKQRMLTQNISKNILYLYHNNSHSFSQLDNSTVEFIYNLNSLKKGNDLTGISKAPTASIAEQIVRVEILWNNFNKNIEKFKELLVQNNIQNKENLKNIVDTVYNTNTPLLNEVDKLVSMYTNYTEHKTDYLRYIQYLFGFIILLLMGYSFTQLKNMEDNAKKFFEFSKKVVENTNNEPLEPFQIEAEKEIVEATDTINCFIKKVNSAVDYSSQAIEQSKNASIKLEEITDEFNKVIDELTHSTDISAQLDKSEDMVIQSQEDLINSTKKLQELKKELDSLLTSCKPHLSK